MGIFVVEPEIKTGRAVTEALEETGTRVQAALWFYFSEAGEWRLVIATPLVDKVGPKRAYAELQKTLIRKELDIDLRRISLVSPSNHLIQLFRSAVRTGPGLSEIRFTGNTINNVFIEDAYIYRLQ